MHDFNTSVPSEEQGLLLVEYLTILFSANLIEINSIPGSTVEKLKKVFDRSVGNWEKFSQNSSPGIWTINFCRKDLCMNWKLVIHMLCSYLNTNIFEDFHICPIKIKTK